VIEHLEICDRVAIVGFQEVNRGSAVVPATVEFSPAASIIPGMLYICRTNALAEVGLYDESFVMYGEEIDLFDRLRLAGWQFCRAISRSGTS